MRERRALKSVVVISLVFCLDGLAATRATRQALGTFHSMGEVAVDGVEAPSGTTLYAGDTITTGDHSGAIVSFLSGTSAILAANSQVALLEDASRLHLRQGGLVIRGAASRPVRVGVDGAWVEIESESGFAATCRIAALGHSAAVLDDRGRVEIHGSGPPVVLRPGQSLRLEAGIPQAGGRVAGKVSNEIPKGVVQRQGQGPEIALNVNDDVNWQDVIRTLRTGRVRVALLDGSFLNVGAGSIMRVIKHDAQTQQTQLELTLGRMRGEIRKLTLPGASFEVRTPTAVIGVVGTTFTVNALKSLTRACSFDGLLSVRNIDPAVAGQVMLHPGECTVVRAGKPPTSPVHSATLLSRLMSQTNLPAAPLGGTVAAAAPSAAPSVGVSATSMLPAGAIGAGAAAAVLGGVAISRSDDARNAANQAASGLSGAASAANSAASEAGLAMMEAMAASHNAAELNRAIGILIQEVTSPSKPCGCQ